MTNRWLPEKDPTAMSEQEFVTTFPTLIGASESKGSNFAKRFALAVLDPKTRSVYFDPKWFQYGAMRIWPARMDWIRTQSWRPVDGGAGRNFTSLPRLPPMRP